MVQRAKLHLPSSELSESFTEFLDTFSFVDALSSSPEKMIKKKTEVQSKKVETRGRKKKEVIPQEAVTVTRASFL